MGIAFASALRAGAEAPPILVRLHAGLQRQRLISAINTLTAEPSLKMRKSYSTVPPPDNARLAVQIVSESDAETCLMKLYFVALNLFCLLRSDSVSRVVCASQAGMLPILPTLPMIPTPVKSRVMAMQAYRK